MALNPGASASLFLEAPSGLASLPLADEGSIGYRAASHGGAGEDAVLGLWVGGRDGATRAHRPGLPPVPLPGLRQAVQRALRHPPEPDPVSLRCHRPRGALASARQTEPTCELSSGCPSGSERG